MNNSFILNKNDSLLDCDSNSTSPKSLFCFIDPQLRNIEVLTMTTELVLSLIGNLLVILTILLRRYSTSRNRRFKKNKINRMDFFILQLSLADLYVSLGSILTMLLWRRNIIFFGGNISCHLVTYFQLAAVYYSVYVLVVLSIDRYEAICKPLLSLHWSKKRGFIFIAIAFGLAHLQGIPQIFLFKMRPVIGILEKFEDCRALFPNWLKPRTYLIYTFLMQFLFPLIIIITSYTFILSKVFNRKLNRDESDLDGHNSISLKSLDELSINRVSKIKKQATFSESSTQRGNKIRQHGGNQSTKSKIKTIQLTATVIILYIICSTPYFFGMILQEIGLTYTNRVFRYVSMLTSLLLNLNSCVNPW